MDSVWTVPKPVLAAVFFEPWAFCTGVFIELRLVFVAGGTYTFIVFELFAYSLIFVLAVCSLEEKKIKYINKMDFLYLKHSHSTLINVRPFRGHMTHDT